MDDFIEYFREEKNKIGLVDSFMYRKMLYAIALEPLARVAFGEKETHRAKLIKLISDIVRWEYADRVSLPQLVLTLREEKQETGSFYKAVHERLKGWPEGRVLRLDISPCFCDLLKIAVNPVEIKAIEKCRYKELFYTYRNNLVHEFREPGYGMEMSNDGGSPYYHTVSHGNCYQSWELVFPVGFFAWLYTEAVEALAHYLTKEGIDPYSKFEFGSRWRPR